MSTAEESPATTSEPAPSASPLDRHTAPVADTRKRPGRAMAALIVGIIAVIAILIPLAGLILGIVAIVLGASTKGDIERNGLVGRKQAKAGMILGIVAVAGSIAMMVLNAAMMT